MSRIRHLYVHLPFCAHRCGYCDFATAVGWHETHGAYVDALLAELEVERPLLAPRLETVFLGGGTPTYTDPPELARLLAALPAAGETTVEANPETVTPEVARLLARGGVTRVSLGAQSFQPRLLAVLERRAGPDAVRRAFYDLRDAGFDNISLDLLYGIPGQSTADLARDLQEALTLAPEHLSCYELEAKPGTRFTVVWAEELGWQTEAMEGHLELVVETLTSAGYRWYETGNFCRQDAAWGGAGRPGATDDDCCASATRDAAAPAVDLRACHSLGYWLGRDYVGLGMGAVSTVAGLRWRNRPGLAGYLAALAEGRRPPRELEELGEDVRRRERLMLGLRLDEPLARASVEGAYDPAAVERLEGLGLLEPRGDAFVLTRRGRLLGNAATVELLAEIPANAPVAVAEAAG